MAPYKMDYKIDRIIEALEKHSTRLDLITGHLEQLQGIMMAIANQNQKQSEEAETANEDDTDITYILNAMLEADAADGHE